METKTVITISRVEVEAILMAHVESKTGKKVKPESCRVWFKDTPTLNGEMRTLFSAYSLEVEQH